MTEIILPVIRLQPSNKTMVIKCICNKEYTFREKKYFLITGKYYSSKKYIALQD